MLRIAVSALSLKPGRIGGVEFMIRNLVAGLSSLDGVEAVVISPSGVDGWPSGVEVRRAGDGNRVVAETLQAPWMMRSARVDAAIFPNYVTPPVSFGVRTVTVIHDLLYRHRPDVFQRHKRLWLRCSHRLTVQRASRIVAISDTVAADLRHVYGSTLSGRLVTVPNPIDWTRFDVRGPDSHPLDGRPYVLSVAAEWPHKNISTLVKAFGRMRQETPNCALVLAGQVRERLGGRTAQTEPSVADTIKHLGLAPHVIQTGHITDEELGRWYRHARVFAFPSLFEGFGMPPVEALGLGLPVVTTRCPSILEATRRIAHYVRDPLDVQELALMLTGVFNDPTRYRPCAQDIRDLRAFYSPARVAKLYVDAAIN